MTAIPEPIMSTEASIRNAVRYTFYAEADPDGIVDRFIEEVRADERERIAREIRTYVSPDHAPDRFTKGWNAALGMIADHIAREGGRTDD